MTFNNLSVTNDDQERRLFHSIFNEWVMAHASEDDWLQLEQARELYLLKTEELRAREARAHAPTQPNAVPTHT